VLVIGLCTWAFWPASEEQLFAKAEALMATGDRTQWQTARDNYLEPLLKRFPDGKHAEQARTYLEQIELKTAQARMELNLRLGRRGKTEGERRYAEAWALEQDGELPDALAVYEELVEKVEPKGDDALYVKLAQQQIATLKPAVALAAAAEKQAPPTEESSNGGGKVQPSEAIESPPSAVPAIPAATTPATSPPEREL
jgi:hypothetical protein